MPDDGGAVRCNGGFPFEPGSTVGIDFRGNGQVEFLSVGRTEEGRGNMFLSGSESGWCQDGMMKANVQWVREPGMFEGRNRT